MKPGQFGKATPEFMGFKCGLQRTSIANHLPIQVFPSPKPGVGSTYPSLATFWFLHTLCEPGLTDHLPLS